MRESGAREGANSVDGQRIALLGDASLASAVHEALAGLGAELLVADEAASLAFAARDADVAVVVLADDARALDALRTLAGSEAARDLPILIVAEHADEASIGRALSAGASEVLPRARLGELLASRIERHLAKRLESRRTAARLAHAEHVGGLGHWTWDGGPNMQWSRGVWRVLGCDPDRASTFDAFVHCIHPDDRRLLARAMQASLREGRSWALAHRVVWPDGQDRSVRTEVEFLDRPPRLEGTLQDLTELRESQRRLRELAYHDPLTSLPTRRLLVEHLARAIERGDRLGRRVGVVVLDLDQFERFAESLGHANGDALLVAVAERLISSLRANDCIARIETDKASVSRVGGDEFAVVLPDIGTPEHAGQVARRLCELLAQPFQIRGHELVITASAGVTVHPDDGSDAERLLEHAGLAMRESRATGRVGFFSSEMQERVDRIVQVEGLVRGALDRGELWVAYQPQVDARSGDIVAAEALVRWTSPILGAVSPAEFVPVAERTGQIVSIGRWVLETACREAAQWSGLAGRPIHLGVNVSAVQLERPRLVDEIAAALRGAALPPDWLQVEITETALIREHAVASETVRRLKQLGVRLSLDDFCTGYSALAHLARFEIDIVKIDRSFVRTVAEDAHQRAVVAAVIGLAHRLGARVVAEGVETREQERSLRDEGCDLLQGFLYAKPTSSADFRAQLARARSGVAERGDDRETNAATEPAGREE